jgi:putative tryptophan/tyrosine transport system substrate-binding protein
MLRRRQSLAGLAVVLSGWPLALPAQRGAAPWRVGWLSYLGAPDPALDLLREGMRDLGHVEGKSYVVVARYAGDDFARLPGLVEELVAERLDVLVTRGPALNYASAARTRVPVVFAYSGDPVEAGFGDSLNRPGRNMTGITFMAMELSAKRVEILKELVPKAARIALLSNPEHSGELREYRVTEETAGRLGMSTARFLVRSLPELATAFDAIRASRPDAMIVFPDSFTFARRRDIAEFAARARIPSMYGWTEFAEAGGLASYGPGLTENFRRLAGFVDKILKGADAGELPIEQVRNIGLTFNPAAAQALALAAPPSILLRADKLIQ